MRSLKVSLVVTACLCAIGLAPAGKDSADPSGKSSTVTLTKRKDNGPYNGAAYSFRVASSNLAAHKNYVDLVFNGCGLLHVSPVSEQSNQICDLGAHSLADSPSEAPADATWRAESIRPAEGHVYLEKIDAQGQTMTVKFRVETLTPDKIKIAWATVTPFAGERFGPGRGQAGTKGQCGGQHAEE